MTEEQAAYEGLFRRLSRIDEIAMRAGLLVEQLSSLELADGLQLVEDAYRGAALGLPDAQRSLLALGWSLFDPRLEKRRAALGLAARQEGRHWLSDMLLAAAPTDEVGEDTARRVPDFGRGRPLTLGERKSLARTHDRDLIQRVVRDPHPDVVRILLDNPALTEEDVVRLSAIRPNDPDVLRAVYRHPRWVVRYRPRHAIVRNPACPLDIGLLLVPHLRTAELKEAAMASGLAAPLRLSCRMILELRDAQPTALG
ncbi:MAG: hypothetical protein AAF500_20075 [Myxococcota bacterium]